MIIVTRKRLAKTENLMPELPDKLYQRIVSLCERGDALAEQEDYDDALEQYEKAWSLLPEPKNEWEAASWIQAAIGDAHFFTGDFENGAQAFQKARNSVEAYANPFLNLRLGQCEFEMENLPGAAENLLRAYMMGGDEVFEDEDPKYFAFLKTAVDPPEGGW
jgi:tetratricopeptide (TPR) repeat protein